MKGYCGKDGERAIWKVDAPLVSQISDVLKQAAIEEGQWPERPDGDHVPPALVPARLHHSGGLIPSTPRPAYRRRIREVSP